MKTNLLRFLLGTIFSVASWAAPQPRHSSGLLVIYGSQRLVEANAAWHGYDLGLVPGRCAISAISPRMLGRLAYVRLPGQSWHGPCVVVDAVGRGDAFDSIWGRHEIGEITWSMAADLGFLNGGRQGEIYFGPCPPDERERSLPEAYDPPRDYSIWPYSYERFDPYPLQQLPIDCGVKVVNP